MLHFFKVSFSLIAFLAAAFFAESVGTITGFGATTILVPLSALFIPLKEAIVLVSLFHFFGTFWRTLAFRRGINWQVAVIFGLPSLIFSAFGASLLSYAPITVIAKTLGVLLIVYAVIALFKKRILLPKHPLLLALGGGAVGFFAGLIGTAGALRGAFLTSWNLEKNVYLGTGAVMGLGADFVRVFVYQKTGLLTISPILTIVLATVALLGTLFGRKLVGIAKQDTFAKIVFIALILAGIRFLVS